MASVSFFTGFLVGVLCSILLIYIGYLIAKISLKETVDIPSILPNTFIRSKAFTVGKKSPKVNDDEAFIKKEQEKSGAIPYGR